MRVPEANGRRQQLEQLRQVGRDPRVLQQTLGSRSPVFPAEDRRLPVVHHELPAESDAGLARIGHAEQRIREHAVLQTEGAGGRELCLVQAGLKQGVQHVLIERGGPDRARLRDANQANRLVQQDARRIHHGRH